MKISEEQAYALNQLQIQRLSECEDFFQKISGFENKHINEKKCSLRNEASEEDENGTVAYYLIMDARGELMFYFSLKCGLLYDEFIYPYLETDKKGQDFAEFAKSKGVDIEQKQLQKDLAIDGNALMTRGRHTYSAIELAHFYRNDNYDFDSWRASYNFPQIGIVVFWKFVVPLVLRIQEQIGCQYLYLFAADDSEDKKLVNYYADKLKFRSAKEWGTVKPLYDFTCEFMCQEINPLAGKMDKFFNEEFNINLDEMV